MYLGEEIMLDSEFEIDKIAGTPEYIKDGNYLTGVLGAIPYKSE